MSEGKIRKSNRKRCIAGEEAPAHHPPMGIFRSRPWLFIVFAFVFLITAWSILVVVAVRNRPESIEVPPPAQRNHD